MITQYPEEIPVLGDDDDFEDDSNCLYATQKNATDDRSHQAQVEIKYVATN